MTSRPAGASATPQRSPFSPGSMEDRFLEQLRLRMQPDVDRLAQESAGYLFQGVKPDWLP